MLDPKWISKVDDSEVNLLKDGHDELQVMVACASVERMDIPYVAKPWLLEGEVANEYWR